MVHPPDQTWRIPTLHGATTIASSIAAPPVLSLGTFNIHGVRDSGLTQAIQALQIGVFDLMVLTDTKITNLACFLNSLRYDVLCSLMITTEDVCAQGGSGLGRPGLTPGLESKFDALPRAYCGELRGCYQRKKDPDNWCIPPSLHPGALTVLGGCPDTLLGPRSYSVRVTQRQHWPSPEPEQSSGC